MLKQRQTHLASQARWSRLFLRLRLGLTKLLQNKHAFAGFVGLLFVSTLLYCWCLLPNHTDADAFESLTTLLWLVALTISTPVVLIGYTILIGTPWRADHISDNLQRAGIVNSVDEPPILTQKSTDKDNPKIEILVFQATGIPFDLWSESQLAIESALNAYVVQIQEGSKRNQVLLYTVDSEGAFPAIARWNECYLSHDPATLVLGITAAGTAVTLNLNQIPHALIGGSTGSGKSVLMGLMLLQTLRKNMELHIVDFKGGLDYNGSPWENACDVLTTIEESISCLDETVEELHRRKALLLDAGVRNIAEYNKSAEMQLRHIVIACDEVAELTDKSGITDKIVKANIDHVIAQLSTIARLGRAFGIHLILATQRPDANVLPGQIKNNIDFRACGRADNTLAIIILDNADAADMIPKDGHRFMLSDGTIFLPYYWE